MKVLLVTIAIGEKYLTEYINLFYESIEDRKACCHIRKAEPLARALKTCEAWITGLRQSQSATREDIKETDWDATHNIHKFNPLATWSNEDVWAYIHKHNLPYNVLHDKGFPSIGCAPWPRMRRVLPSACSSLGAANLGLATPDPLRFSKKAT